MPLRRIRTILTIIFIPYRTYDSSEFRREITEPKHIHFGSSHFVKFATPNIPITALKWIVMRWHVCSYCGFAMPYYIGVRRPPTCRCRQQAYCDAYCQRRHWPSHGSDCVWTALVEVGVLPEVADIVCQYLWGAVTDGDLQELQPSIVRQWTRQKEQISNKLFIFKSQCLLKSNDTSINIFWTMWG